MRPCTDQGARRSQAEAKKWIDEKVLVRLVNDLGTSPHDWLAAQVLYGEAETLRESTTEEPKK